MIQTAHASALPIYVAMLTLQKEQVKTRLASTVQAGVQTVCSLATAEALIGEATVLASG